ncbi:small nuclear ribonucleoprotein B and B' [Angomonas deanei]|nr:small nuclear ribonucleoprotein B and B' [Angomonas deanei]|eukprot:EPY37747.1 small nuclear ribonucleoprotein B and B' [Angomonas deanei]
MGTFSMINNINKQLKLILDDGRKIEGKLLAYDKHMNVVMSDATEERPQTKKMAEEGISATRQVGLILLRGEHLVSVTVVKSDGSSEKEPDFSKAPKSKKGDRHAGEAQA